MQLITSISSLIALPLLAIVKIYQLFISPLLGQNCRFHPSCSCYAREALQQHGAFRGSWLSIKRIVKCQPLHPGGIDYVPSIQKISQPYEINNNIDCKTKSVINKDDKNTIKNSH